MNKQMEEENDHRKHEELEKKVQDKMKRKEVKDRQDQIKAKLAKEINLLRKKEQEENLKLL